MHRGRAKASVLPVHKSSSSKKSSEEPKRIPALAYIAACFAIGVLIGKALRPEMAEFTPLTLSIPPMMIDVAVGPSFPAKPEKATGKDASANSGLTITPMFQASSSFSRPSPECVFHLRGA